MANDFNFNALCLKMQGWIMTRLSQVSYWTLGVIVAALGAAVATLSASLS